MTKPFKGIYYYLIRIAAFLTFAPALVGLGALKAQYIDGTLLTNINDTSKNMFMLAAFVYFVVEIYKYGTGYTEITTTEYKLFKCRESGKDEAFMMFADSVEELERFFECAHPNKVVFIEEAQMSGKSVQMKIFNQEYEDRQHQ